jgi:hypothetical protein
MVKEVVLSRLESRPTKLTRTGTPDLTPFTLYPILSLSLLMPLERLG